LRLCCLIGLFGKLLLIGEQARWRLTLDLFDHRARRVEHDIDRATNDCREGRERDEEFLDGQSPRRKPNRSAKKAATAWPTLLFCESANT
jgi:hypothetical protein